MTKRKLFWLLVLLVCVAILIWLYATGRSLHHPVTAGAPETGDAAVARAIPKGQDLGQDLVIDFEDHVDDGAIQKLAKSLGLTITLNSIHAKAERLYRAHGDGTLSARTVLTRLRRHPSVEYAEVDTIYSIGPIEATGIRAAPTADAQLPRGFPNDPQFRYQWHLDQIGMQRAWPRGSGQGVIVAVIDTGVAFADSGRFKQVPDLKQTEFVPGYDFINKSEQALDDHGHGTHVAGTIAQSTHNGVGVAGVAYRARIMPIKVLSARGFGSVANIADGIHFAADHGAKVINMSLGASRPSKILESAVRYAHKKGVVVVCAAGNEGRGQVGFPAAHDGAIAVAATQFDRTTTFYSNWGKEIDVAAPGGNTRVDQNNDGMPDGVLQNTILPGRPDQNDYLLFMGTSMAAPHVAGAAALVIASGVTDPDAVEQVLKRTAVHPKHTARDDHYGTGIIDAGAALGKTVTEYGAIKLVLGLGLTLLLLGGLGAREGQRVRFSPTTVLGTLLGASGFFFLGSIPRLGSALPAALLHLCTAGFPAWDQSVFGAGANANPLFYSALVPVFFLVAGYRIAWLRRLAVGFAAGVAAHLLFVACAGTVDVQLIPSVLGLDLIWLGVNAAITLTAARLAAR